MSDRSDGGDSRRLPRAGRATIVAVLLVVGATVASHGAPGTALGPVIAITPFEVQPNGFVGQVVNPMLSGRGQAAGVHDQEVSEFAFVQFDVAGPEPMRSGGAVAVSGDGCVAVWAPRSGAGLGVTDRCRGTERVVDAGFFVGGTQLALSHDGRFAAMQVVNTNEFPPSLLRRVDTSSGAVRTMPLPPGLGLVFPRAEYGIDISDDGSVIAAPLQVGNGVEVGVWTLANDQVAFPAGLAGGFTIHPSLSGDGRWVALAASVPRAGGEAAIGPWVYVIDRSNNAPRLVSPAGGGAYYSSLSRDGSQVAYSVAQTPGIAGCKYDRANPIRLEALCPPIRVDVAFGPAPGFTAGFHVEPVSLDVNGRQLGEHRQPALSGNGRWVAWVSDVGDALLGRPLDLNGLHHAFMRRRDPGLAVDAVDFGPVAVDTAASATTAVRNTGRTSVWLDSIAIAPGRFSVQPGGSCAIGTSLPPGASCTVNVRFDAGSTPGDAAETLVVTEIGFDAIGASGALRARVPAPPTVPPGPTTPPTTPPGPTTTPPPGATTTAPGNPALSAEPDPVDFGPVAVGFASATRTVIVTNDGDGSGQLSTVLGGAHPDDFFVSDNGCNAVVLGPGSTCAMEIVLIARDGGDRTATLTVSTTGSAVDIELSGQGRFEPRIAASPEAVRLRGITTLIGQGFPPGVPVTVEIVESGVSLTGTPDATGLFRVPFVPLGRIGLGGHVLHVDGVPAVYDEVEGQLVVVLPTFEPQGPGGPAFGSTVIVTRGR